MRKVLLIACCLSFIGFSSSSYALQGQGKVVKIKACGAADVGGWFNYVFFKLSDGSWFGIYANHSAPYDSNFYHSILLTAFSMQLDVDVNATYATETSCGITADMLWNKTTDYLEIVGP